VVLGGWFDSMSLEVFSNLNDSMILFYDCMKTRMSAVRGPSVISGTGR